MLCEKYSPIIEENKEFLLEQMKIIDEKKGKIEMSANNNAFKVINQVQTNDDKLSYDIVDPEKQIEKVNKIPLDCVDYFLERSEDNIRKCKEDLPISFLMVNSVEGGKAWYLNKYPDLLPELAELMARYNWGDLKHLTKQEFKRRKKKYQKKGKIYDPLAETFNIKYGKFKVEFD